MLKSMLTYGLVFSVVIHLLGNSCVFGEADELDSSFGDGGLATVDFFSSNRDSPRSMAMQSDGRIIVLGRTRNSASGQAYEVGSDTIVLSRYLPSGESDSTFGDDGRVILPQIEFARWSLTSIEVQPDGGIVCGGAASFPRVGLLNAKFGLVRFNSDGTFDASFGDNGRVIADLGEIIPSATTRGESVAIQPDGRIILAGWGYVEDEKSQYRHAIVLARFQTTGELDASFGDNGVVFTLPNGHARGYAATIQPDGKILVAGDFNKINDSSIDFVVVRYVQDGLLDESFGDGGVAFVDFKAQSGFASAIALQSDGGIVVGGQTWQNHPFALNLSVVRLTPSGDFDSNFGTNGRTIVSPDSFENFLLGPYVNDQWLTLDESDRVIVASGTAGANRDLVVFRFLADGHPDVTFGNNGTATLEISNSSDTAVALVSQPGGSVIAFGSTNYLSGISGDFLLTRLFNNGVVDSTFGDNGIVITDFLGSTIDEAEAMAVDHTSGRMVLAGSSENFAGIDIALARIHPNGSIDESFGVSGRVTTDISNCDEAAYDVEIQQDAKIVVVGSTDCDQIGGTGKDFVVARYLPDGNLDSEFGDLGIVVTDLGSRTDVAMDAAIQSDSKIVAVGITREENSIYYDFAVVRYLPDGSLDPTFGIGGVVKTDLGYGYERPYAVEILPDDQILLAGFTAPSPGSTVAWAFVRYLQDGSLDPDFGDGGIVVSDFGNGGGSAMDITLQPDGRIVSAGYQSPATSYGANLAVTRLNSNGSIDTSFGANGLSIFAGKGVLQVAYSATLQQDGRIVAPGASNDDGITFAIARVDQDGQPDPSFGNNGYVRTEFEGANDARIHDSEIQIDGRILAGGFVQFFFPTGSDFAVARYQGVDELHEEFELLIQEVRDLVPGSLSSDQAAALLFNIQAAIQFLDAGDSRQAFRKVIGFVIQVGRLTRHRALTRAEGHSLIVSAVDVIRLIARKH